MMERLQEAIEHCYEVARDQCGNRCANEHIQLAKWLEDLQDFYTLKGQGKLLKLPCKPGDTVYVPHRGCIQEMTVLTARIDKLGYWFFEWKLKDGKGIYPWPVGFSSGQIGKYVFLTEQEALEALEGMKE